MILASGYDEAQAIDNLDREEPAGFLRKPYDQEALASKLREFCHSIRLELLDDYAFRAVVGLVFVRGFFLGQFGVAGHVVAFRLAIAASSTAAAATRTPGTTTSAPIVPVTWRGSDGGILGSPGGPTAMRQEPSDRVVRTNRPSLEVSAFT